VPGEQFDDVPEVFLDALRRHAPVLLHCHHGMFALEFQEIARVTGLPLVVSFYGYDASAFPLRPPQNTGRLRGLFAASAAVLAMSDDMAADLVRLGCPAGLIRVHMPSVDLDRFRYRSDRADTGRVVVLSVSDFTAKKGVDRLIDAFALVHARLPSSILLLVGSPPASAQARYESLAGRISALGLNEAVEFRGWQAYGVIPKVYSEADILVVPSEVGPDGSKEGVPAVILEAMATGLPIVSTRHAGIPETVVDGATGLLVEEGDVQGLADAILQLATMGALRRRMGAAGRRRAESTYDLREQRRRLEGLYVSICGGPT